MDHRCVRVGVLLLVAAGPCAAQATLGIHELHNASGFREAPGQRFTFVCQPSDGTKATIYGTDTYTDSSAICAAAIHAGVLRPGESGQVTIAMGKGAKEFNGSERKGVVSHSYRRWDYWYTFGTEQEPGDVTWTTAWKDVPEDYTEPVTVSCPQKGRVEVPVWGTDVYVGGSGICAAAVHAGAIGVDRGGVVTVSRAKGQGEYPGSERNRVESRRWGAYEDAFTVAAAATPAPTAPVVPPPEEELPPTGPGVPGESTVRSRTIAVAGFSGSGSAAVSGGAPPIANRTIPVVGFAGSGSAAASGSVAPQTIAIAGWSGSGSGTNP